ncbi:MAG: hypothetical protein EBQ75_07395 [Actinobacteria bacterium]|nr:hypothetical protein [Actinomycetota bacterium]
MSHEIACSAIDTSEYARSARSNDAEIESGATSLILESESNSTDIVLCNWRGVVLEKSSKAVPVATMLDSNSGPKAHVAVEELVSPHDAKPRLSTTHAMSLFMR